MKIEEHIQYWVESAEHDLESAESLYLSGKYDWSLFIGHLVLEKVLKGLYVRDNQNQLPPKTHNLVKLAENTNIVLNAEQKFFLDEVNDFNLEVRYPEYMREFYKKCTKDFAESYFIRIKEMFQWIKSQLELQPS
jgi:HEPN domain-containing protein